MEWFQVTVALYQKVFTQGVRLAIRNWPVLATVFVYLAIMVGGSFVAMSMGFFGGFVLSLLSAACISSFLALVETIIRTSRVTLQDFRGSFGTYLWDVVGVSFVFWLFGSFAAPIIGQLAQGQVILLCVDIAIFVFFNAVPELIYLGHFTVLDLLRESYAFISDNWIEWFPANLLIAGIFFGITWLDLDGVLAIASQVLLALLLYFAMIVRGLLFLELHGSSRRGRAFKYRTR